MAFRQTHSGSIIAAAARLTSGGSLNTRAAAVSRPYSAKNPSERIPGPSRAPHRSPRPVRQSGQAPHAMPGGAQIRSPTATVVTPLPTSTTSPENSWPRITGTRTISEPRVHW